ncbi:MAG: protein kinase [Polyangiaceae bacterium]
MVGGRYEVVRFIAQGGMGEVYEALDRELGVRVALKRLLPAAARSRRAIERFKREIQLARRVTHPNVCRIFDLGVDDSHRARPDDPAASSPHAAGGAADAAPSRADAKPISDGGAIGPPSSGSPASEGRALSTQARASGSGSGDGSGSAPAAVFLTMELLEGETLAARIRRGGRMTPGEALPVVEQIVRALAALHEAGIVHRDLKSSNVVLVEQSTRVVVTDFGLASVTSGVEVDGAASATGAMVGSPATMAPEQVEGRKVSPAADVYSLGVVLFEMVTGELPFSGPTRLATAFKRLRERAPSPRTHVPDLDARWEATILRCLMLEPEDRYGRVGEVVEALTGPAPRRPLLSARVRHAGFVGLVSAAALVVGVTGYQAVVQHKGPLAALASTVAPARRPSVAVLGFKTVASGDDDAGWLSVAFSEMLHSELGSAGARVVPSESVARMKADLKLTEADSFAADTLGRIRRHLDADYVVNGSLTVLGKTADGARKVRLDVRLQDTDAGELLEPITESGTERELAELVGRVVRRLSKRLELTAPGAAAPSFVSLFQNSEVGPLYAEGISKLRSFDAAGARPLLERAVALAPDHPLPHSALAQALGELGQEQAAKEEARKAYDHAAELPPEERLLVEARYQTVSDRQSEAIESYRKLYALVPDNLDYAVRLVWLLAIGQRNDEATGVVAEMRRRAGAEADDPRVDLAEAWATPNFRVQLDSATRARDKARARGARLMVAEAEDSRAFAYVTLGDPDQAAAAAEEARRIYVEVGNPLGAIRELRFSAEVLASRGRLGEAISRHEEAVTVARQAGALENAAASLVMIAGHEIDRGDLSRAAAYAEEARELWEGSSAQQQCPKGLPMLTGCLELQSGNLGDAEQSFRELDGSHGPCSNPKGSEMGMAEVAFEQDDLAAARLRYERGLAEMDRTGRHVQAAQRRVLSAWVMVEAGKAAEAEPMLREVIAAAQRSKAQPIEATATALLARTLSAQAKGGEAREAVSRAVALGGDAEVVSARLAVAVAAHTVRGEPGDEARLRELIARLQKGGMSRLALHARLALWAPRVRGPQEATARRELTAIEKEARAAGSLLVARLAREALAQRRGAPRGEDIDQEIVEEIEKAARLAEKTGRAAEKAARARILGSPPRPGSPEMPPMPPMPPPPPIPPTPIPGDEDGEGPDAPDIEVSPSLPWPGPPGRPMAP